jgi:predicted carbohydrate-binding protein with CBM5 and CBM33 domain
MGSVRRLFIGLAVLIAALLAPVSHAAAHATMSFPPASDYTYDAPVYDAPGQRQCAETGPAWRGYRPFHV